MVNATEKYKALLQEATQLFDALLALYLPDKGAEQDFAARTVLDIQSKRTAMLERLARAEPVSTAMTATLIQVIGHYLDGHWDDYREIPTANPAKFARREQLHADLEALVNRVAQLQVEMKK
ncbi:hypothetical protein K3G63_03465 [Hymenobacter sp. HSC-4F20]|uniref:hypothetical protein n=1 Tax=Hymenobacter sp. HSC-4F20 TaxID=2864135 RepID=UPI001C7309DC|nr:hypothetical protein [Hymenobacter sp. HSC-4F20]MBX0289478.1 hypothetical protein [Hymenobacter sp. HSC-4F20]